MQPNSSSNITTDLSQIDHLLELNSLLELTARWQTGEELKHLSEPQNNKANRPHLLSSIKDA